MTDLRKAANMAFDLLCDAVEPTATQVQADIGMCAQWDVDAIECIEILRQALAQSDNTSDSATRSADSAESFCKQELHNLMSVAGRMALELECLLLDTENLSVVSKWWDTGMEALQAYRHYVWSVTHGKDGENFCDTHCVHTDHHPDCELAQPEQEPVCDKDPYYCGYVRCQLGKVCKNTAPPKREWVGLTDDEIDSIFVDYGWCISTLYLRVVRSIEAKLKEKNT